MATAKGHEAVRQMSLNAPKYGNGIEWVDEMGWNIEHLLLGTLHKNPKPHDQEISAAPDSGHGARAVGESNLVTAEWKAGW